MTVYVQVHRGFWQAERVLGPDTYSKELRIAAQRISWWEATAMGFILWLILLFFCWPLAIIALVLYPVVWLFLLPFRILGFAVEGVLEFIRAIFMLPSRVLSGPRRY